MDFVVNAENASFSFPHDNEQVNSSTCGKISLIKNIDEWFTERAHTQIYINKFEQWAKSDMEDFDPVWKQESKVTQTAPAEGSQLWDLVTRNRWPHGARREVTWVGWHQSRAQPSVNSHDREKFS